MTVDTWKRMEDVFLSIVDLPLDEQQRLLDAQCASDERLKEMVEAMLAADRKNGRGIQAAVEGEVARLFESPPISERSG